MHFHNNDRRKLNFSYLVYVLNTCDLGRDELNLSRIEVTEKKKKSVPQVGTGRKTNTLNLRSCHWKTGKDYASGIVFDPDTAQSL